MTTLAIKDLAITEELDAAALAAVSGGTAAYLPAWMPLFGGPANVAVNASQTLDQAQNVVNNNGNNVAFACGISSTVNPSQSGSNNITL